MCQVKEFSTFLCMGRFKSLGSLKSCLWYAPQLSGALSCIFRSWVSSWLIVGSGCNLMAARWHVCFPTRIPQGSSTHAAGLQSDDCYILVYWYGRNIPFLNTNRSRLSCWQKNILSISHTMSFPGGQKESSLKTTTCGTYHLLPAGLQLFFTAGGRHRTTHNCL